MRLIGTLTLFLGMLFISPMGYSQIQENKKSDEEILKEYRNWSKIKNDWANLEYYRDENKELDTSAKPLVVFFGNSITKGWKKNYPEFFKHKNYVNRGIGGQTTPQMLVRFRQDVIDLEPDVVLLLAGTNDIAGNTGPSTPKMIVDNIASMAELAMQNDITVILSSILPVYKYPWAPTLEPANEVIETNKRIKKYADKKGIRYVDYYSEMVDTQNNGLQNDLANDGVHPNLKGFKIMSELAEEAILEALSTTHNEK